MNQRQEQFRSGYRLQLALLLMGRDNARAAYELQRCLSARQAAGHGPTRQMQQMMAQLQGVTPVSDAQQQDFYLKMKEKYK